LGVSLKLGEKRRETARHEKNGTIDCGGRVGFREKKRSVEILKIQGTEKTTIQKGFWLKPGHTGVGEKKRCRSTNSCVTGQNFLFPEGDAEQGGGKKAVYPAPLQQLAKRDEGERGGQA